MRKSFMLLLMAALLGIPALAQQMPPLPIDPKVRVGKLDNGLTYYIRHNVEPKGQAEFFIVQKAGSILEEESQRGLAHFLEHMAFKGTKNFPKKNMISYLAKVGVEWGPDLNGSTEFNTTIYQISNAPIPREGIVDSCLLALHDWSNFITLADKDIESERNIIREEWRTRTNAQMRIHEKAFSDMYVGSQYANRMPIGLIEVINNFKHKELRDYYKKWYRPDLQGLVVVGDIDVDKVEAKIKTMFADIAKPVTPAERTEYEVKDNDAPIVSLVTDPETSRTQVKVYYKRDVMSKQYRPTVARLINYYLSTVTQKMLNDRLQELTQKANAPFLNASCSDGNFFIATTKDAFLTTANCKEGEIALGLSTLANEAARVRQYGFTASEYERAKSDFLSNIENELKNRDKQKNGYYVDQYVENFLNETPALDIEAKYELFQQAAMTFPVEKVNKFAARLIGDKNIVIAISGPQKDGVTYPTKDEVVDIFSKGRTENVTAYVEKVSNEPLMATPPKAGKVVKEEQGTKFGETIWTLSNGARVAIKKTDFKEDEIVFVATSKGGTSLIDDKDAINSKVMNSVIPLGGVGNFSTTDLSKMLAGKKAEVSALVDDKSESLTGKCSPKDLETMMQLAYLTVAAPRMDTDAFQSYISRTKATVSNMKAQPMSAFSDSITYALFGKTLRNQSLTADLLDKVDYQRTMELYRERFANIGDFTFTFVGNIDLNTLRPMVEQYIASLPGNGKKENFRSVSMFPRKGEYKNHFEKEMKTPKASFYTLYTGKADFTVENKLKMTMLGQLMDMVYTRAIRDDKGGSFSVRVSGTVDNYPYNAAYFFVNFDTDPNLIDMMVEKINLGLDQMVKGGPSETDLAQVKKFMLKSYTEKQRSNSYWRDIIDSYYTWNIDRQSGFDAKINATTASDIKAFIGKLLAQKNAVNIIMKGFEKK